MKKKSKQLKSFKYTNPETLKVGEDVFIGDMDSVNLGYCLGCQPPSDEFISNFLVDKLVFDKPCDKHKLEK